MNIYGIRDKLAGWLYVMSSSNDDVARRNFYIMYNPEVDAVEDYELWKLGSWSLESGKINAIIPEFICRGVKNGKDEVSNSVQ